MSPTSIAVRQAGPDRYTCTMAGKTFLIVIADAGRMAQLAMDADLLARGRLDMVLVQSGGAIADQLAGPLAEAGDGGVLVILHQTHDARAGILAALGLPDA